MVHEGSFADDIATTSRIARFAADVDTAEYVYAAVFNSKADEGYRKQRVAIRSGIGSPQLHGQWFTAKSDATGINEHVRVLLETVYEEARQKVASTVSTPLGALSAAQIHEAESLLLAIRLEITSTRNRDKIEKLSNAFYSAIPHTASTPTPVIDAMDLLAQKQDLCQTMKDLCAISESTSVGGSSQIESIYRSLHCEINHLDSTSRNFQAIKKIVDQSSAASGSPIAIKHIYELSRPSEVDAFRQTKLPNHKTLFHSSKV